MLKNAHQVIVYIFFHDICKIKISWHGMVMKQLRYILYVQSRFFCKYCNDCKRLSLNQGQNEDNDRVQIIIT